MIWLNNLVDWTGNTELSSVFSLVKTGRGAVGQTLVAQLEHAVQDGLHPCHDDIVISILSGKVIEDGSNSRRRNYC